LRLKTVSVRLQAALPLTSAVRLRLTRVREESHPRLRRHSTILGDFDAGGAAAKKG